MPQTKQYATAAEKQAAYRERKRLAQAEAERVEREAQAKHAKHLNMITDAVKRVVAAEVEAQREAILYRAGAQVCASEDDKRIMQGELERTIRQIRR